MYARPSNQIYESNYINQIKKDEFKKASLLYNKAQNPIETGIIGYSSNFMTFNENENSLTGQPISEYHNNMTPFLTKNVTQNTNILTENFATGRRTGNDPLYQKKQETECFFKPEKNIHSICGMKNNDDFYKSRINGFDMKNRNNDFPIEPIRVGPGINKGYTSTGSGGFQQAESLKYSVPADLQVNRPKTDQRSRNFNIPLQAPPKKIDKRTLVGQQEKYRPDTYYEKSQDMLFKTTGLEHKQTSRSIPNILPTSRLETHVDYKGISSNSEKKAGIKDDYGKSGVLVYDNERQITETRTVKSNLTTAVKAIIAPITDTLKNSIKEYLVDAPRQNGNMQTSMTERPTTYDPVNHIMKTTIKETTIHDNDKLNLKGNEEGYTALYDDVKITTKETTIHDNDTLNLKGNEEGYTALYDDVKTTTKETTPIYDILRNIGSTTYKVTVYDPDIVMKKTNKETTIVNDYGFLGGFIETLFGGYLSSTPEAKNTQKQLTTVEYTGIGNSMSKNPTSHEATNNAEIDATRETLLIAAGHIPNAGGKYTGLGKDKIKMKSEKLLEDSISTRQSGNLSKVYQQTPEINKCSITKENEELNSVKHRLDPSTLTSLNNNPFSISVNKT